MTGYPPPNPSIRGVAFDMDGLILNTEDLYELVCGILMQRRGKTYREEVRNQMIGLPAIKAFGVLIEAEGLSESWQELQQETDDVFETILDTHLGTMPGVDDIFREIDSLGLPRCVATSSTQSFARRVLGQTGILDQIDFLITAEDVRQGKPNPDIYIAAAQRLGIDVTTMLVLEDSQTGTKAGVDSGAYVISVPNKHTEHGSFVGAKLVANTLLDPIIYSVIRHNQTAN